MGEQAVDAKMAMLANRQGAGRKRYAAFERKDKSDVLIDAEEN
jgi:hypothetical protein